MHWDKKTKLFVLNVPVLGFLTSKVIFFITLPYAANSVASNKLTRTPCFAMRLFFLLYIEYASYFLVEDFKEPLTVLPLFRSWDLLYSSLIFRMQHRYHGIS